MQLGIVVPCYNEEEVLPETRRRLTALVDQLVAAGKISVSSQIYFVDDGSSDSTWKLIEQFAAADPHVAGIKLSRNRGHQNALMAGLFAAEGDALISIDADLQDDLAVIEQMVDKFHEGLEIVYGGRMARDTDSAFKRVTAAGFYKLIAALGAESVYNHADYRLLSRRGIDCLKEYGEGNLFLRGIIPLIGFRAASVLYSLRPP